MCVCVCVCPTPSLLCSSWVNDDYHAHQYCNADYFECVCVQKYDPELIGEGSSLWVGLSCVFGIAIGYTGWAARDMVSATTYTLVGVVNKLISVRSFYTLPATENKVWCTYENRARVPHLQFHDFVLCFKLAQPITCRRI